MGWERGREGPGPGQTAPRRHSEEAALTDAHGVREVPPRAGLAVLEVVLQQHLAQLVALGKERGPQCTRTLSPGPIPPAARAAGTHPVPVLGLLEQHLLQGPQHLDAQLLLRLHEVLGVLDQPAGAHGSPLSPSPPPAPPRAGTPRLRPGGGGGGGLQSPRGPSRPRCAPPAPSLGQEAPALAALVGLAALQEEQLGPVQDVHQHGQLGLHQRLQALLQGRDDVLGGRGSREMQGVRAQEVTGA